jgi:Fe-S-cluster containining protein
MFSPAIEKQRRQLYAQAVEAMGSRLQSIDNPDAMFAALRKGMQELDKAHDESPVKIRTKVACRAGCSHCCSVSIDVQAHEVFLAAEYIQVTFSAEALAAVIERTAARRARVKGLSTEERDRLSHPCALLAADGRCTIYEGRPEACRVHHTSDASVCEAHAADRAVDLEAVYIPELRARVFAVMLGLDEALESAGYDDRAYDFGSALNEALTNSLCRVLWLRHKPAFPDSCLAG